MSLDFSEEEITLTSHEDYLKRINLIRKSITKTLKQSIQKIAENRVRKLQL